MSIARYNIFTRDGFRIIEEDECGEYVLYYDHDAAILFAQTEYQNISTQFAAMRLRAEKAEATLDEWRKAYSRNILSHDEEEDDEAAHLHAVACADQAMREGDQ